ncbi:hypothetical protein PG993_003007 [Apiospora rasikravindrae]|uniref:Rhodopsin domain-containing protein n=1 Tax=Apiospora rasikravindrae TaxID=990691 RepID=A0ABR1TYP8_9PEZI
MDLSASASNKWNVSDAMYAVPWIMTCISIGTVGTRFYLRKKFSLPVDVDDWVMAVAVLLQIGFQSVLTVSITKGVGRSLSPSLDMDGLVDMLKWSWLSNPLAVTVSVVACISITILLVRLFNVKKRFKWFMITFTGAVSIMGVLNVVVVWFQASPAEALWDFRMMVPRWDPKIQQIFSATLHGLLATSDLLYVVFPVMFVWKLHMPARRKVGLSMVLALGLITFALALVKLVGIVGSIDNTYDVMGDTADVFYVFSVLSLISSVEQNLVIIIGCVPKIRSISKLASPFFSYISTNLVHLLSMTGVTRHTKRSSTSGASEPKYDFENNNSGHLDLEMQPHTVHTGVGSSVIHNESPALTGQKPGHIGIRRTDEFSVS